LSFIAKKGARRRWDTGLKQAGAQPHIRDTPPTIFQAEASRAAGDMDLARETLAKNRETLADDRRVLFDRYRLVDAAIKVVGIGGVGTLCMVALMVSIADHPFFLQIKQANASVLEAYAALYLRGCRIMSGGRLWGSAPEKSSSQRLAGGGRWIRTLGPASRVDTHREPVRHVLIWIAENPNF
jgi:hypothetical protein